MYIVQKICEFLYKYKNVDKYYIISSDSDFSHIAREIQRCGKLCILIGGKSNSNKFLKNSVNNFFNIEDNFVEDKKINVKFYTTKKTFVATFCK